MQLYEIPILQINFFSILVTGYGISSVTSITETTPAPQTTPSYKHTLSSEYNNFPDILASKFFLDKTALISQVIENESPHLLFTAPSHFGKTTNLGMLMTYLELPINWENGEIVSKENTYAYEVFYNSKTSNLTITTSNPDYFQRHFMEYSVIGIDLSDAANYDLLDPSLSYESRTDKIITKIKSTLFDPVERYECVLEKTDRGRGLLQRVLAIKKDLHIHDLENILLEALFEFVEILREIFPDKKVILLADGYDYWIEIALHLKCDAKFILATVENILLRLLNSGRSTVDRSCIFGTFNVIRAETSSSLRDILVSYPFLEGHKFESYFGVTENELKSIFGKYNVSSKEEIAIEEYYAPYISKSGRKIYPLRSVKGYFNDRKIPITDPPIMKPFFTAELVPSRMFSSYVLGNRVIQYNLMKFLLGYPVKITVNSSVDLTEFNFLEHWFQNKQEAVTIELATTQNRLYFSLLLEIGLITYYHDDENIIILPNTECTKILETKIKQYLWQQKIVSRDRMEYARDAVKSIINESYPEKEKLLEFKTKLNKLFFSEEEIKQVEKYEEELVKFDYQCKIAQLLHPIIKLQNRSLGLISNETNSGEEFAGIAVSNDDQSVVTIFEMNFDRGKHEGQNYYLKLPRNYADFRQLYLKKIIIDVIRRENYTIICVFPTVLCNCTADIVNYLNSEQNYISTLLV
ncbi:uncharacterized protein LOC135847897 [Planococcus citri]|uniref:uncharacterized protein LOC135847897 n=1 Tax=Planococcus citri TaxID=170843 RepID=UPI0031F800E0